MTGKALAKKIRKLREDAGMSRQDMANELAKHGISVTASAVGYWEGGNVTRLHRIPATLIESITKSWDGSGTSESESDGDIEFIDLDALEKQNVLLMKKVLEVERFRLATKMAGTATGEMSDEEIIKTAKSLLNI